MTIRFWAIILVMLYASVCLGFFIKLKYYEVQNNKIKWSILGPFFIMVFATIVAWSYTKEKSKKNKISIIAKALIMINLVKINIQCFPALMGFLADGLRRLESSRVVKSEETKIKQGKHAFTKKSYELYDDVGIFALT